MTNQLTHVADVKVGKVKGKSRTYPQIRLPSEYFELVGKKASIYETSEHQGETTSRRDYVCKISGISK
jgi:hypothetical protein